MNIHHSFADTITLNPSPRLKIICDMKFPENFDKTNFVVQLF